MSAPQPEEPIAADKVLLEEAPIDPDTLCIFSAFLCCYQACYTDFPRCIGGMAKGELLCIEEEICCKVGHDPMFCDQPEGMICQLGLGCCAIRLKEPATCCRSEGQLFCIYQKGAFPFDPKEPMICALYGLSCFPALGCCKSVAEHKEVASPTKPATEA